MTETESRGREGQGRWGRHKLLRLLTFKRRLPPGQQLMVSALHQLLCYLSTW